MRRTTRFTLFLFLLLALPGLLFAQSQSGTIRGTVVSAGDQAPLPGVTLTITGTGFRQTFVTDVDGEFRFLGLHPGTYTVEAQLAGFSTVRRNVDVSLGRNSDVTLSLTPALSEAITVVAATPVIDTRDTGTGQNVEDYELMNVPTARDPWVVLQSIPGVLVDRVNIGGNESGQQSYFVGKGVERHQTEWNVDGVAVTDMAATGTSTFYYDFDSFDEIQVTTGGADPSVRTPGVQLNMVTKQGSNEFKGSGRFFMTDADYQAEATIPDEAIGYLEPGGNSINHIDDYGFEVGGPILRDKLWAWGAFSANRIENFAAGEAVLQRTNLDNYNAKLNYQPFNNNNAEIFYMWSDKAVAGRGLGSRRRTLDVAHNQTGPGDLLKIEDTHVFSQSLYVTGNYAMIDSGYVLDPIGGRTADAWWDVDEGWHRSYYYFEQVNPQKNARVDGSSYLRTGTLNHELKFGFGYRDTPVRSETVWPGSGNFGNFYDGYALAGLTRPARPNFGSRYVDLYVGDTLVFNDLTLTGGFRYDIQRAKNFGSSVAANPVVPDLLPAVTFAGDERALEWKGISPRIGATWALGGGQTVLRTSYNRYMDQLGSSDVGASNPFYRTQRLYYYWEDANDDKTIQREEILFDEGLYSFNNIDPDNPGAPFSAGRIDYNMDPTTTDEFVFGFEREIAANFAVGAAYSYRYRTNFVWDQYEKTRGGNDFYTSADYVPDTRTPNVTGTLPDGTPYSVPNYRLRSGTDAPVFYVTKNRPDYHQTYHGIELTATKRLANRWMMRGNITLSDWKQHVGDNGFVDPTPIVSEDSCSSCDDAVVASSGGIGGYINSRWSYSLNTAYELPLGFTVGAAVVGREGYVIPYYRRQNNRDGLGSKDVMVSEEFGSERLPDLFNLDLRLARDFGLPRGFTLNLAVDLFNVTNERTVLWRDNRMYSANGPDIEDNNWIEQLQSPRVLRFGARVRF
ncbi:MAG TPA: carboxypeptidase regulatory-like domain-containing protein [Thermoanaerobaculia bacterium]|jgi:hypothetical protein